MRNLILVALVFGLVSHAPGTEAGPEVVAAPMPVSISVTKREKIDISDLQTLKTYATNYNYYFTPQLREGMKVLYSTSYGIGGEAGQAAGVIVKKDGKFWFKQHRNPTGQLLLPPGQTLNSQNEHSLWDIGAYMELINNVALGAPTKQVNAPHKSYGYKTPVAYKVDFKGGTAGDSVKYTDAMEVTFERTVSNRSYSEFKVYYAKGIGPVALEFRENKSPSGTFKIYIGE